MNEIEYRTVKRLNWQIKKKQIMMTDNRSCVCMQLCRVRYEAERIRYKLRNIMLIVSYRGPVSVISY